MKDMSPLEQLRHSAAHILAAAVLRLYPQALLDIGPPTSTGFYHDFDLEHRFTEEDFAAIEDQMRKIVAEKQAFIRTEVTREEARKLLESRGQEFTLTRLDDIPENEAISLYQNGEFINLCAGLHVKNTGEVQVFKLLKIAGAYHRGDEKNKQLQRIYGTAFFTQKELDEYLHQQEEAKKRDHRKLGKELRLFHIEDKVGPGLILWQPAGAAIRQQLQNFILEELQRQNYSQVFTPHIGKLGLYRTSGHYPYYKDSQFPPIIEPETLAHWAKEGCSCADLTAKMDSEEAQGYLLKPMNCPHHIQIYRAHPHSYRDLPIRLAEFGTVYRWEQSGELGGMTRARAFTQDDAHLFCTPEQVPVEIEGCLRLVKLVLGTLGMNNYRVRLSLRNPDSSKYVGSKENWDRAEEALRQAVKILGVPYSEEPGEAAFYGPKIDFVVSDVIGREWQLGTVQLDYNLPERFELEYVGADNKMHRPVMIHRAPFGSMERFCAVLIEHFAGDFPTWLAPEQVRLLPLNDGVHGACEAMLGKLKAANLRAAVDSSSEKLGAKIRRAELEKVPHMLVVGAKEVEAGTASVRSRADKGFEGTYPLAEFITKAQAEVSERRLRKQ